MQVNSINNYQNFNGASKMLQKAANHIKNNVGHYCHNGSALATAALTGQLNSLDGILRTKLFVDAAETVIPVITNNRNLVFASPSSPKTNIFLLFCKAATDIGKSLKMAFIK